MPQNNTEGHRKGSHRTTRKDTEKGATEQHGRTQKKGHRTTQKDTEKGATEQHRRTQKKGHRTTQKNTEKGPQNNTDCLHAQR
jgi:hypothetical protein